MVGLALSAGGTRAASHIGVISVLEEMGFPIDIVAGTSMGAGGIEIFELKTFGAVESL